MAIEIIDTLGQKNNGIFPLVDSNDVKGGYYQVDNIEERDSIPNIRRKVGMLCYVENDIDGAIIYQLKGGIDNSCWEVFKVGSGGDCDIHVGEEPPTDDTVVWLDISDIDESKAITNNIIDEMRATVSHLQQQINDLMTKNIELEIRVLYLEMFGIVGGNPDGGGSDNDNNNGGGSNDSNSNDTLLTDEDNNILIDEDGAILIFEEGVI